MNIPKLYKALEFFGLETGAFSQLTQEHMTNSFNPRTPDREGVRFVISYRSWVLLLTSLLGIIPTARRSTQDFGQCSGILIESSSPSKVQTMV